MTSRTTSLLLALAASVAMPAAAQQGPGPTTLTVHPLKGGAYWVSGGSSNGGFVVGDRGVVLVDAQRTPDDARKEVAAVAEVTPKPIDAAVLTHADPDHVGGLPAYPALTTIVAQENTRSAR